MEQVPEKVFTKDLSYIDDMLSWNFTLIKKINAYIENVEDEDVKEILVDLSETFKTHYSSILESLNIGGAND